MVWKWWRRGPRLTVSEVEIRQVRRLTRAVVRTILAEVGESVLQETLDRLKAGREDRGNVDYTSLAEIWLTARKRCEDLKRNRTYVPSSN